MRVAARAWRSAEEPAPAAVAALVRELELALELHGAQESEPASVPDAVLARVREAALVAAVVCWPAPSPAGGGRGRPPPHAAAAVLSLPARPSSVSDAWASW